MNDFGAGLRSMRQQRSWTQREAAAYLAISPQFYNDMEHGRRAPGDALADRIEIALGVAYRTPREARIEGQARADAASPR